MAVSPEDVLSGRGAARIRDAWLDSQDVGSLRVTACRDVRLGSGDLAERAAEVQRRRLLAARVRPRHRTGQGVVGFADSCSVPEAVQRPSIAGREFRSGDRDQRAWRDIEQDGAGGREFTQRPDLPACLDGAAAIAHVLRHRPRDLAAATHDDWPSGAVGQKPKEQRQSCGGRLTERHHPVGGQAGEQGTGLRCTEAGRYALRRPESRQAISADRRWLPRRVPQIG